MEEKKARKGDKKGKKYYSGMHEVYPPRVPMYPTSERTIDLLHCWVLLASKVSVVAETSYCSKLPCGLISTILHGREGPLLF